MENINKKKIILLITIIIIAIIIVTIFFIKFNYRTFKSGNNINKSEEEIINYILNISKYSAMLDVEITSNKNVNKYIIKQEVENQINKQEIIKPENISGIISKYSENNLEIINNKMNLSKLYQDYEFIVSNDLWLNSFIELYKKDETDSKITINENEIVLEITNKEFSKYNTYKKLYIDKSTGKPTKMIIENINQKTLVYILYNEIEIS